MNRVITVPIEPRYDDLVRALAFRNRRAVADYVRHVLIRELYEAGFVDQDGNVLHQAAS